MSDIKSMIKLEVDSAKNVAHSLILTRCLNQPKVGTDAYLSSDAVKNEVASRAVWKTLVHFHGKKLYSDATSMTDLFRRVPGMAPTAGWLWESICHTKICEGGTFNLRHMYVDEHDMLMPSPGYISVDIRKMEPIQYASADISIAIHSKTYFYPSASNNRTFDSFFFLGNIGIGLQMTLAPTHTLNTKGLLELHKRLGKKSEKETWFAFVIRRGSSFKCKAPSLIQREKFSFCTMEVPLPQGEHNLHSPVGTSVDDVNFAEVDPDMFNKLMEVGDEEPDEEPDEEDNGHEGPDEEMPMAVK